MRRNSDSSRMMIILIELMLPGPGSVKRLDFYISWFLKDNIYQGSPRTIPKLKATITEKIAVIS